MFYDELLATRLKPPHLPQRAMPQLLPYLESAEIFNIQNVARYFFEVDDKSYWQIGDFPNIAPPYETFWMEHEFPRRIREGDQVKEMPFAGVEGFLIMAEKAEGKKQMNPLHKWNMGIVHFLKFNNVITQDLAWAIGVNADGSPAVQDNGDVAFSLHTGPEMSAILASQLKEHGRGFGFSILCPVLLAISFLHCKNVSLVTNPLIVKRKRQPRQNQVLRYHVLRIEPLRRILKAEGQVEQTGLKQALHLVRGHFADYTEGRGLFGKHKGIYWRESHVRGSGAEGVVVKDYEVEPPVRSRKSAYDE